VISQQSQQPEPPYTRGEFDESQFDEEALHARRRQYGIFAASVAILTIAILAIPWRDNVKADGRVAPQRWAQVRSKVSGVVQEAAHTNGDVVEEGAVIAVLDYDEQRDALDAARFALEPERQKLADLELRLRENSIQRQGADAVAKSAGERAIAAERIDGARLAALGPIAETALDGVRGFATEMRAQLSRNSSAPQGREFNGEQLYGKVRHAMARYSEQASSVADQLAEVAGSDAGRQFRFELEDLNFAYNTADHSMQELLAKYQLVQRGFIAPVALREPCIELERETMELAHGFRALSGSARTVLGSPEEQSERVRGAEESRRILESESERLESERASVESEIAAAELAVRSAERNQGKTVIRAPIRGTLSGTSLARFDAVVANTSLGVVEDGSRLVLKVNVDDADFRRVNVGQMVEARALDGRSLHGAVVWTTPLAGQAVHDQAWNVLVKLDVKNTGLEIGEKVVASIGVGRRSLLWRWLKPADKSAIGPRVAFVEDPTELRKPLEALPESVAAVPGQAPAERSVARTGPDGS
jgi:multidrug resistance efflux pump